MKHFAYIEQIRRLRRADRTNRMACLAGGAGLMALAVLALPLPASASAGDAPASGAPRTQRLYVAPWGEDTGPGSHARPFATLERAQRTVRERTARMRSDIVVELRGGTYRRTGPLQLSAAAGDSGTGGHRVVYQAYGYGTGGQERVTLSGGRPVTGWRPVGGSGPGRTGVWRAEVGGLQSRQLYVDGRRAERTALGRGLPGKVRRTASGYVTDTPLPRSWRGARDMELLYRGTQGPLPYSEARCGIAAITGTGRSTTITMDQPCWSRLAELYRTEPEEPSAPAAPTDVLNSPDFLTQPGSWYLDRSRAGHHVAYYLPRRGQDPRRSRIVAPVAETLISGRGERAAPLHDLAFRGLELAHTTWLGPDRPGGFPHIIGSWYSGGGERGLTVPGAASFRRAERITFEGGLLHQLGGQGLVLTGGSRKNALRGNAVEDVSAGGITVGVDGDNSANLLADNRVRRVGAEYHGGIGIAAEQARGSVITHNEVSDTPYTGIWGESSTGLRITGNRVLRTVKVLPDGGGIYLPYAQGTSFGDGAVVDGNVVQETGIPYLEGDDPAASAVYADVGADHVTVTGNVLLRNGHALGGVQPRRIRVAQNFWDDALPRWRPAGTPTGGVDMGPNTLLPRTGPIEACRAAAQCARALAGAGPRGALPGVRS